MEKDNPTLPEQQISKAVGALRSDDVLMQNAAVEQLIHLGATAVPELLKALLQPEVHHARAMYALARIGDQRAVAAFKDGLCHHNEEVRAYAAQGLARIKHPDALKACLQTLNDAPDPLHLDITPAVTALADLGFMAVPSLLSLLNNEDKLTRLHAQRALEIVISKRHGFVQGQGFPSSEAEKGARAEWIENGDYDYRADKTSRTASIAKWQRWLESVRE